MTELSNGRKITVVLYCILHFRECNLYSTITVFISIIKGFSFYILRNVECELYFAPTIGFSIFE